MSENGIEDSESTINAECSQENKLGNKCGSFRIQGTDHCYQHRPPGYRSAPEVPGLIDEPLETIPDAMNWIARICAGVQTGETPPGMANLLKGLLHEFIAGCKVLDYKDPRKIAQQVVTEEAVKKAMEGITPTQAREILVAKGLFKPKM